MPLLDVDAKVIYGAITVGGAASGTDYHLARVVSYTERFDEAIIEFEALVQHDVEATFVARCAALREAFRTPEQRLQIFLGATERRDYNPANNSGFDASPDIQLLEEDNTDRSARYLCTVRVGLPADKVSRLGRRIASIETTEAPSGRRTVTIQGTWTALGSDGALDQYTAEITAYSASVLASVGGIYELVGQSTTTNDTDKVLFFSRQFSERVANQSVGGLDAAGLISSQMSISVDTQGHRMGSSDANSEPPKLVRVSHQVFVGKGLNLADKYESVIRPHIFDQVNRFVSGTFAVLSERPSFDIENSSVVTEFELLSFSGLAVVEETITTSDQISHGRVFVPLANGAPFTHRKYSGPRTWIRTIARSVIRQTARPQGNSALGNFAIGANLFAGFGEERAPSPKSQGQFRITGFEVPEGWHVLTEQTSLRGPYHLGTTSDNVALEGFSEQVTLFRSAGEEE